MTDIGKGDFVQCVDASNAPAAAFPFAVGAVLQVAALARHLNGDPAVGIAGDLVASGQRFWLASRFRPIHPGGALTRLLMEPVSDRIEQP